MTSSAQRAAILVRALHASVEGDPHEVEEVYTDDVKAWTPALSTSSLTELKAEFDRRDDAFSAVDLDVRPFFVAGDYACAEWTVSMTHSGPLAVADGLTVQPSGVAVTLHGMTVAEFRGEQICSLRQYWDELSVYEQLGLLSREPI
jgi:ketosteroid isomerase-like protein